MQAIHYRFLKSSRIIWILVDSCIEDERLVQVVALEVEFIYTYLSIFLMTKTIAISDKVYKKLQVLKFKGESFSDVIDRLAATPGKLSDILDLYPELSDLQEFEDAIYKNKEVVEKRASEIQREFS